MKEVVDGLNSVAGWVTSGANATVEGTNDHAEYIAGEQSASLIFRWDNAQDEYIEKPVSFGVGMNEFITFYIWSRNLGRKGYTYQNASDFVYKLDFGNGREYLIPTFGTFNHVTVYIADMPDITRIRFTALHDEDDYLIVSHMVASRDEFPIDLYEGFSEMCTRMMNELYYMIPGGENDRGVLVASNISGSIGDSEIFFDSVPKFIEKYTVIKIDDGVNSEIHQVIEWNEDRAVLGEDFEGPTLKNNYTGASVYLIIPVVYANQTRDLPLPCIAAWGFDLNEVIQSTKEDTISDSMYPDGTVSQRIQDMPLVHTMQVDVYSRSIELLAVASRAVRRTYGREFIWVNGKKIDIGQEANPSYSPPVESYNEVPKTSYTINMQFREEIWNRARQVPGTTQNLSVEVTP